MTDAVRCAIMDLDGVDLGDGRYTFRTESLETAQEFYVVVTYERMERFGRYGATLPIGRERSLAYRELVRDCLRLPPWWTPGRRMAYRIRHKNGKFFPQRYLTEKWAYEAATTVPGATVECITANLTTGKEVPA